MSVFYNVPDLTVNLNFVHDDEYYNPVLVPSDEVIQVLERFTNLKKVI